MPNTDQIQRAIENKIPKDPAISLFYAQLGTIRNPRPIVQFWAKTELFRSTLQQSPPGPPPFLLILLVPRQALRIYVITVKKVSLKGYRLCLFIFEEVNFFILLSKHVKLEFGRSCNAILYDQNITICHPNHLSSSESISIQCLSFVQRC